MGHEDHDHGHDHPHTHPVAHAHQPARTASAGAVGVGVGKVLFLDAPSGLAGDMIVAALVDLGVPREAVADAIATLPVSGFHLHFGTRVKSGIVATSFEVHEEKGQPQRTYAAIRSMLDGATGLPEGVRRRAQKTLLRLATAEAKVHRMALDDVHFHEVGAVDAIVDIVGSAAALEHLGAELVVSPLPLGRGYVKAAHGTLPLPAPATVECLTGLATYDAGIDFELVTPTGAAIVGAHAAASQRWPSMTIERVGWGAGRAELADRPNVLRAVLGARTPIASGRPSSGEPGATHAVLEANIDDATGELAGAWIEALLEAGAVDAWATPITMKKSRPAFTLAALAPLALGDAIASVMLRETTTLGVRRYDVVRQEAPRRMGYVDTPYGRIPVKIVEGLGPPSAKPEFDACMAAARAHEVPVRHVMAAALAAFARVP